MSGKGKFYFTLSIILLLFIASQIILYIERDSTKRPVNALLNQYFALKEKHPKDAKRALDLILQQEPKNQTALRELGYWFLKNGDQVQAIKQFKIALANDPSDTIVKRELDRLTEIAKYQVSVTAPSYSFDLQLKKLIPELNKSYTPIAVNTANKNESKEILAPKVVASEPKISLRDQLLNQFYNNKAKNERLAWDAIEKLLQKYPDDVTALKEAGYYALSQHNNALAYIYFEQVYEITHDPYIALQIGYILDSLGKRKQAYRYFSLATDNPNLTDRYKAEIALTNLRGMNLKLLPDPFFFDVAFNPFYYSRFKLIVYPLIARTGVVINKEHDVQLYLIYRRYSDNKSGLSGAIPQIFEDNVAVIALGIQGRPFAKLPLSVFMEGGRAKDLIYQNRPRWRGDFRTGLAFYNDWGHEAEYTFTPRFPFHYLADVYADLIYFSRFRNTIGTIRARPGFEVFRLGATSIDVYLRAFLIEDTQRQFYNNLYELGPGIVFIPSDRYNIAVRYEFVQGHYLPAGSPTPNPYGAKYHNNVLQIDFYSRS